MFDMGKNVSTQLSYIYSITMVYSFLDIDSFRRLNYSRSIVCEANNNSYRVLGGWSMDYVP